MYEQATVLQYDGEKIWIKHIEQTLYCINGIYTIFDPKQDLSNIMTIVTALDEWYCPLHSNTDPSLDVIRYDPEYAFNHENLYTVSRWDLPDCGINISNAEAIRKEYQDWSKNRTDIRIRDYRDMDVNEWLDKVVRI